MASYANPPSIFTDGITVIRIKALLAGGRELWIDHDDAGVADTEAAVRETYLTPNSIPVAAMGRLGTEPRSWWVSVDAAKIRLDDFYTVAEATAAHMYATDPSTLAWKDHYLFLDKSRVDLIGSLDYLGDSVRSVIGEIVPKIATPVY